MNITFLLGNGFDLNLGLETGYTSFLKDYRNVRNEEPEYIKWFKDEVLKDEKLWSSAEVAFGISTKIFSEKKYGADMFCDCHEDFCMNLAQYLEKQEARINYAQLDAYISSSFAKSLAGHLNGFREVKKKKILDAVARVGGGNVYNFISFNYTTTVDKCIESIKKNKVALGKRFSNSIWNDNSIGSVLHVHGYTYKDMVLGVNDETQILDKSIFEEFGEEYLEQLIKIKCNQMNEENTDGKVFELLKGSDIIYIYGMSIGETDALWWKRICNLMKVKKHVQLIIHKYDAPEQGLVRRKYVTFEKDQRMNFLSFSELSDEEKIEIASRIHIDGSNMFSLLSKLTENEANVSEAVGS